MIVVYEEDRTICELFDTASEFKDFLYDSLSEIQRGLREDGLLGENEGVCNKSISLIDSSFSLRLETWTDITGRTFQIE